MGRLLLASALLLVGTQLSSQVPAPQVFGPDHITEVYRVSLDRGASLLESIDEIVQSKAIRDGQVIISSGSVQDCPYHFVASTDLKPRNDYRTVKGPAEILGGGGIIADGEPHIHISLSSRDQGVYGGHLEKGCRVLYLAEITVFRFGGSQLTRKSNQNGIFLLQQK